MINKFLSHNHVNIDIKKRISELEAKIKKAGDLPGATLEYRLKLLHEFAQFDLGKFIILNSGLNGYWTEYILYYSEDSPRYANITPLEKILITKFPVMLATQQRCKILLDILAKNLRDNISLASIPCGTGHELLNIKGISTTKNLELNFIDLDKEILVLAQQKAQQYQMDSTTKLNFVECDAWKLSKLYNNHFNIVVSSGLTIYEHSDDRVLSFFIEVFNSMKSGGIFIISTITLSPLVSQDSEWDLNKIEKEYLQLSFILFTQVLEVKWGANRSTELMIKLLKQAGFSKMEVIYDEARIFPNIIALKA
jgi:SAM-dependent methyltransferase